MAFQALILFKLVSDWLKFLLYMAYSIGILKMSYFFQDNGAKLTSSLFEMHQLSLAPVLKRI